MPAQAAAQLDREAGVAPAGSAELQPAYSASLPAEGRLPVPLGVRLGGLGGTLPRCVVHPCDALADRADEEDRAFAACSPPSDPELVSRPTAHRARCCRRFQQQAETDHQKILRLSRFPRDRNRAVSRTW